MEGKIVPGADFLIFQALLWILFEMFCLLLFAPVYAIISVCRRSAAMRSKEIHLVPIPDDKGVHIKSAGAKGEKYVYKYIRFFWNSEGLPSTFRTIPRP